MSENKIKDFRFAYRRKIGSCKPTELDGFFRLNLTQEQFEDFGYLRDQVHLGLDRLNVQPCVWHESPKWRQRWSATYGLRLT